MYEDHYSYMAARPRLRRPPRLVYIDFMTCGLNYHIDTGADPVILRMDCSTMLPPPKELCLQYCGLDRELSDWLFSHQEYRVRFKRALDRIEDGIEAWRPGRDGPRLCVIVNCQAGVHRSVAMAERLARKVNTWRGVRVTIEYVVLSRTAVFPEVPLISHC